MSNSQQQAQEILARLAFIEFDRCLEINYPVEVSIEMALAGYLDSESIGFVDCQPNRDRG